MTPRSNPNSAAITDERYSRQAAIAWWDQRLLSQARILVAGAGAIGNEVVKLLALMGVHNLTIVDFDQVEITNLSRCVLFRDCDVGKYKATVSALRAHDLDPDSEALGIVGDLEYDVGLGVYRNVDVVIGCLDSINARLALNRLCLRAGTPWLNGGIEDTFGEVSLHYGSDPCFECGMSESMWERRNTRFSCGGLRLDMPTESVPTTAAIASIIAGYLVNEALLVMHFESMGSKPGLLPGEKLLVSLKPYDFRVVNLTRNPNCAAHDVWQPIHVLARGPDDLTPLELLHINGDGGGVVELGFDLLTDMTCIRCGANDEVLSPVEKCDSTLTYCGQCQAETRMPTCTSWIDSQSPLARKLFSELYTVQNQVVAVNSKNSRSYYQLGGDAQSTSLPFKVTSITS